jgi:hypothetical protein
MEKLTWPLCFAIFNYFGWFLECMLVLASSKCYVLAYQVCGGLSVILPGFHSRPKERKKERKGVQKSSTQQHHY